jgi:hypothetical protein
MLGLCWRHVPLKRRLTFGAPHDFVSQKIELFSRTESTSTMIHHEYLKTVTWIQSYWNFGLFPSSGVFGSRNKTFRKLDLFPSSGEGEGTCSVGALRKIEINSPFTWGRKQIQFPKRCVSTLLYTQRWRNSKNPVTLCAIHHHQNPIISTVKIMFITIVLKYF